MGSPGPLLRLLMYVILAGAVLQPLASGQTTDVTAEAKVKFIGAVKTAERHSNEGVVLWLTPVGGAVPPQSPNATRNRLQLAQKNKEFVPHLLVVQTGNVVDFPNVDPFFHNVFSLFNGKRFDLGLYESGSSRSVHFDRPGVSYIFCNIHPEMSAVVVSVPTPYFATSSTAGNLVIHDVAPGTYMMHVWAIGTSDANLVAIGRRVTVSGGTVDLGTIALEESVPASHKNKFGEDYDTKNSSPY
jgi:plastocyanin